MRLKIPPTMQAEAPYGRSAKTLGNVNGGWYIYLVGEESGRLRSRRYDFVKKKVNSARSFIATIQNRNISPDLSRTPFIVIPNRNRDRDSLAGR